MEKEKKSIQDNLLANSFMFTILSVVAVGLGLFFFFYGIFFSVLVLSGMAGDFAFMSLLQAGLFFAGSLIIFYIFAKNSKWLWALWQRKFAIDAEDKRISRLVDESALADSHETESSERIQQNKQ